jgi:hypothetical protein
LVDRARRSLPSLQAAYPEATIYVVAEAEAEKAIDILKAALARPADEYKDLGRVSDALLNVLSLSQGQFARA